MFKQIALRLNALRIAVTKNRLIPVLVVLVVQTGGCWACGGSTSEMLGTDCSTFKVTSVSGLPSGPVTVTWDATKFDTSYTVYVASVPSDTQGDILGKTDISAPANKATVVLDQALANKAIGQGAKYMVNLYSFYGSGPEWLCYAELQIGTAKKMKSKPAATATPVPQLGEPPKQNPPAEPTKPPVIKIPPIIIIPTCPPDKTGTPPNCIDIPR